MKLLLSPKSKKDLLKFLLKKNFVNSLKELSYLIKIPKGTLNDWFYNERRYLPERIIPLEFRYNLKILDSQDERWGNVKGEKRLMRQL